MKKLTKEQNEFYKRVDEILFYRWDPIGISSSDWSRDEYQSYALQVFGLAVKGESAEVIADYLATITTEDMGLAANERDIEIARQILQIKYQCLG